MFQSLLDTWKKWSETGIHLPFCYDPENKKPSITLGFYWISASLSIISLILLHLNLVTISATGMSILFVLLGFIMYRLRKLDKVKIDIKNQSVDLEDTEESKEKENK